MPRDSLFEELYRKNTRAVVGFFVKRGFSSDEANDLAQETFLRVYKAMDTMREPEAARKFAFTTAANIWRNELRNRGALKRSGKVESLDAEGQQDALELEAGPGLTVGSPEDETLLRERRKQLSDALNQLPPRMRTAVKLRVDQGLKYHEIAAVMGVSIDTIKAQLYQARGRLREILGADFLGVAEPEAKE